MKLHTHVSTLDDVQHQNCDPASITCDKVWDQRSNVHHVCWMIRMKVLSIFAH